MENKRQIALRIGNNKSKGEYCHEKNTQYNFTAYGSFMCFMH